MTGVEATDVDCLDGWIKKDLWKMLRWIEMTKYEGKRE
jgi:hypothetical protein